MSHAPLFRRVIAMDRRELWFRALSLGRREAGHVAYLARQPQWRREELAHGLRLDDPRLDGIVGALLNRQWESAHRGWLAHMARRPRRFILDPSDRESRNTAVRMAHPYAIENAIRLGERIRAGRFDLLGYRDLTFASDSAPGGIDWHLDPVNQRRVASDHWSRVRYLDACERRPQGRLGAEPPSDLAGVGTCVLVDRRRAIPGCLRCVLERVDGQQPAQTGVNWASMLELSLRSISWLWALHFFAGNPVSSEETHAPVVSRPSARPPSPAHARRTQSFAVLQPEHAPAGRSAGTLRRGTRAPGVAPGGRWESLGARCSWNNPRGRSTMTAATWSSLRTITGTRWTSTCWRWRSRARRPIRERRCSPKPLDGSPSVRERSPTTMDGFR